MRGREENDGEAEVEIDSQSLLRQGDELLRSSRALLDDLEEVVPDTKDRDQEES